MNAQMIDRIETNFERAAALLFGAAVGYAVYAWLSPSVAQAQLGAFTGVAAALACVLCRRALAAVSVQKPRFPVTIFDVREIETFDEFDELVLTEADRLDNELVLTDADRLDNELLLTDADRFDNVLVLTDVHRFRNELVLTEADRVDRANNQPLDLDDVVAELGPDARVVRLFDPKSMPTPGQLKTRIDTHLEQGTPPVTPSDASQALSEALAELRRSLR
jgi:hypothetical protein